MSAGTRRFPPCSTTSVERQPSCAWLLDERPRSIDWPGRSISSAETRSRSPASARRDRPRAAARRRSSSDTPAAGPSAGLLPLLRVDFGLACWSAWPSSTRTWRADPCPFGLMTHLMNSSARSFRLLVSSTVNPCVQIRPPVVENDPVEMRIGGNKVGNRELGAAVDHVDIAGDERVLDARDIADELGIRLCLQATFCGCPRASPYRGRSASSHCRGRSVE